MDELMYNELIKKIKDILNKAMREGEQLSYTELGKMLNVSNQTIKEAVAKRFTELTKKALNPFNDADPDFYLLGDSITEICNNKEYLLFKKKKMKQLNTSSKFMNHIGKINKV